VSGTKKRSKAKTKAVSGEGPELSAKDEMFAELYLEHWNASEAARLMDLGRPYGTTGHRMLHKSQVQAYLARRIEDQKAKADEVLVRLTQHSRATWDEILELNAQGRILGFNFEKAKKAGVLRLIKKISVNPRTGHEAVELVDQQGALDKLARAHKLYGEEGNNQPPGSNDRSFWEGGKPVE
jgi:hypothetical protein